MDQNSKEERPTLFLLILQIYSHQTPMGQTQSQWIKSQNVYIYCGLSTLEAISDRTTKAQNTGDTSCLMATIPSAAWTGRADCHIYVYDARPNAPDLTHSPARGPPATTHLENGRFNAPNNAATLAAEGATQAGSQGFRSFTAFKRAMGPAGPGQAWHHIVEQTPGNIARFGPETIHNTANLVKLPHGAGSIHARVSGLYSSIRPDITGSTSLTVRQWLGTQSFEVQSAFGQRAVQNITSGTWP